MVLHHMQKVLEFGQACCRFTCKSVGATLAIVASYWYSSRGPSTTYLGIQRSEVWGSHADKAALFRARTSEKTGVKRTRLRCTELHKIFHLYHPLLHVCSHLFPIIPLLDSGKLFEFACPIHCWTSNRSSSKRLPLQHSASPSFMGETHDVASKFPVLISAIFSPCLYVTCLNHFLGIQIHAYWRYANLGSWKEVDDVVWNSHLPSFVNFCRM